LGQVSLSGPEVIDQLGAQAERMLLAALVRAGPAGVLISYCLVGAVIYLVMTALGEMSSYLPLPEGFSGCNSWSSLTTNFTSCNAFCRPSTGICAWMDLLVQICSRHVIVLL